MIEAAFIKTIRTTSQARPCVLTTLSLQPNLKSTIYTAFNINLALIAL
jgi:hypothetical protein